MNKRIRLIYGRLQAQIIDFLTTVIYVAAMAQTKPIPVRLSAEMLARLDQAADRAHLSNRTEVIKLCISSFLDYFETHGKASLPLDWENMLSDMDGRAQRYSENSKKKDKPK